MRWNGNVWAHTRSNTHRVFNKFSNWKHFIFLPYVRYVNVGFRILQNLIVTEEIQVFTANSLVWLKLTEEKTLYCCCCCFFFFLNRSCSGGPSRSCVYNWVWVQGSIITKPFSEINTSQRILISKWIPALLAFF